MNKLKQKMNRCEKISKGGLIILNSLSFVGGILAMIGGMIIKNNIASYKNYIATGNLKSTTEFFATVPALIILLGAFVAGTSLCGCCGSCLEKVWLLKIYKVILIIMLSALVILAGLTFAFKSTLRRAIDTVLRNYLQSYEGSGEIIDLIQNQLHCCGVEAGLDWQNVEKWKVAAGELSSELGIELGSNPVPDSCCIKAKSAGCGLDNSYNAEGKVYTDGCSGIFWDALSKHGNIAGLVGLLLAGLLLLCVVFTCSLITFTDDAFQRRRYHRFSCMRFQQRINPFSPDGFKRPIQQRFPTKNSECCYSVRSTAICGLPRCSLNSTA